MIAGSNDDFNTPQCQRFKCVLGEQPDAARGNLLALHRRPDPIAKIAYGVLPVDLVQTGTTQEL